MHVLGDGHRRDQREVLVDHPEAGGDRVPRGAERHRPPVDEDLPGIGLVQPVEDVHQRALPGAVLAEEGMDLAGREGEVDAVVGDDAGEPLDDAAELDGRHRAGDGRRCLAAHLVRRQCRRALRARARTLRASRSMRLVAELRQLGRDALVPPVHAGLALGAGGTGRELVEVGLLELLARGEQLLAGVVRRSGPAKTSKRSKSPASILASVSLTLARSAAGRSATPLRSVLRRP